MCRDALNRLAAFLTQQGVRVYFERPPHPTAAGLYRSETREIWIHPHSSAEWMLLTLAHEAGHWIGYIVQEKPHAYQRERQAYVYGWKMLQLVQAPITRAGWLDSCRESELGRRV